MSIEHIKAAKKSAASVESAAIRDSDRSVPNPANPIIPRTLIQTTPSLTVTITVNHTNHINHSSDFGKF